MCQPFAAATMAIQRNATHNNNDNRTMSHRRYIKHKAQTETHMTHSADNG